MRGKLEGWAGARWEGSELWPKELELELVGKRWLWKRWCNRGEAAQGVFLG